MPSQHTSDDRAARPSAPPLTRLLEVTHVDRLSMCDNSVRELLRMKKIAAVRLGRAGVVVKIWSANIPHADVSEEKPRSPGFG